MCIRDSSSGADPGPALREAAGKAFFEACCEIGAHGKKFGVELLLEPLDRLANKRNLLGPTDETLAMIQALRQAGVSISFAWDAAHAALNEENLEQSLDAALPAPVSYTHLEKGFLHPRRPARSPHRF